MPSTISKRYEEAFAGYDKALALKPDLVEALAGCGSAFSDLKRYDEALAAYDKALALKPGLAEAWLGRGNVLNELKRCDEALAAYDNSLALKADLAGSMAWSVEMCLTISSAMTKRLLLMTNHSRLNLI